MNKKTFKTTRPEMITFEITSKCNLNCYHCYNDSGGAGIGDMSFSELLETAHQISLLRPFNCCLCGGEPLCCPCLADIIGILRLGVGKISMVCNGWSINKDKAEELAGCGLDVIQISLDGAYAWQHDSFRGVVGSFDRAATAIRLLKLSGIKQVYASFIPNKLNIGTMPEYLSLCRELGVDIIRVMPYLPLGRGRTIGRAMIPNEQEYFVFCRKLRQLWDIYGSEPLIQWTDPLSHLRVVSDRARRGDRNLDMQIRANGDLAVSAYLSAIVGNVREHTLEEYWNAGFDSCWSTPELINYIIDLHTVNDLEHYDLQSFTNKIFRLIDLED